MLKKVILVLVFITALAGCVSPMKVSSIQNFTVSRETPITVHVLNDHSGVQGRVEAKLLELGLNVVPIDIAKKAIELKQAISTYDSEYESNIASKSSLESNIYYPSALIVSVSYQIHRDPFMTGFQYFNARFIDLSTQKVLGIASFSQEANWVSLNYTLNNFAKEMKKYVE